MTAVSLCYTPIQFTEDVQDFRLLVYWDALAETFEGSGIYEEKISKEIIPAKNLYSPKVLLADFPAASMVTDFPDPVPYFYQIPPYTDYQVSFRWTPPQSAGFKPLKFFRITRDLGVLIKDMPYIYDPARLYPYRDYPVKFYNPEYQVVHEQTHNLIQEGTVVALNPLKRYMFDIVACNDEPIPPLFHAPQARSDGGGCNPVKKTLTIIPRVTFPVPTFRLIELVDYYPDDPGYLDYTFTNPKYSSGKATFEILQPEDTPLTRKYRVYANKGWNKYVPSTKEELVVEGAFVGYPYSEHTRVTPSIELLKRNYTFTMTFVTDVGETAHSPPIQVECCKVAVPEPPPLPPERDLSTGLNSHDTLSVTWGASLVHGAVMIEQYEVECWLAKRSTDGDNGGQLYSFDDPINFAGSIILSAGQNRTTFSGLLRKSTYVVRVRAISQVGKSRWGPLGRFPTTEVPSAPTDLILVSSSPQHIELRWGPPVFQGIGFNGYMIFIDQTHIVCNTTGTGAPRLRTCNITDIPPMKELITARPQLYGTKQPLDVAVLGNNAAGYAYNLARMGYPTDIQANPIPTYVLIKQKVYIHIFVIKLFWGKWGWEEEGGRCFFCAAQRLRGVAKCR